MPINTHILDASKEILPYSRQLKLLAESIVTSVDESSFVGDIDIVFCHNPGATSDEMGGVDISLTNPHSMIVSLNPHHKSFDNTLKKELQILIIEKLKNSGFIK